MADDDAPTGGSRLFTVRIWTERTGLHVEQRGTVRDPASGAFRNFRKWSELTSFLAGQLEERRAMKQEEP